MFVYDLIQKYRLLNGSALTIAAFFFLGYVHSSSK